MCGFSFYLAASEHIEDLHASSDAIRHRGPDASGIETGRVADRFFGLAHRRLSILDLSERGDQPMSFDGRTIAYNGEIYNFRMLREELRQQGIGFVTDTDTEVLLKGYIHEGDGFIEKLEGMFAFIIVDTVRDRSVVVRDPLGIKPLYLYSSVEGIFGCSEIKGLVEFREVETKVSSSDVFEFFQNGFVYEPRTGFEGIEKLMPGSFLVIESNGRSERIQYARPLGQGPDDQSAEIDYEALVGDSIRRELVADAPVGIFFSGGIDSTVLALESGKDAHLLSVSYGAGDGESESASDDAAVDMFTERYGRNLTRVNISHDSGGDILESFRRVASGTEELVSDFTYIASQEISEAARRSGFKVMLSGMGADEVFAGYPRYLQVRHEWFFRLLSWVLRPLVGSRVFPGSMSKKIERFYAYFSEKEFISAYSRLVGYFDDADLKEGLKIECDTESYVERLRSICGPAFDGLTRLKKAMLLDRYGFLSHNLTVADKSSMAESIELRVPFVNRKLFSAVLGEPDDVLIRGWTTKYILKKMLRGKMPDEYIDRPKRGFNPPLDQAINRLGQERILEILENGDVPRYVYKEFMGKVVANHFSGRGNQTYKIWQLLYFHYWLEWAGRVCRLDATV